MTQARDIHGNVFAHGSATLLARVTGNDATVLLPSGVHEIRMSILLLDTERPEKTVFLRGYHNVDIPVGDVLFTPLRQDARWTVDEQGYKFRHTLTNKNGRIFTQPGRHYLAVYKFIPAAEFEKHAVITVRFSLFVI